MSVNFQASFAIKPDYFRVGNIFPLTQFIQKYPDEDLTPNLLKLQEMFKYYRPICGDGNCFYRACAFLYLSVAELRSFENTFQMAPVKDCIKAPFDLEEFKVEEVLFYIWKEYLLPLKDMNVINRRVQLSTKLNGSVMLDSFLIAYLRSLVHQHIRNHRGQFAAFIEGNFQTRLKRVLEFGREAQGIELFAMAELLRVKLTIMMVHKENFQKIVYMENGRATFDLFFRPGHYDILSQEDEYQCQKNIRNTSPPPIPRKLSPTPGAPIPKNTPPKIRTFRYKGQQIEPQVVMIKSLFDFKDKQVLIWKFPPKQKPENVESFLRGRGTKPSEKKQPKSRSPRQTKRQDDYVMPQEPERQNPVRRVAERYSPERQMFGVQVPERQMSARVSARVAERQEFEGMGSRLSMSALKVPPKNQPYTFTIPNINRNNIKAQAIAVSLVIVVILMTALLPPPTF